MNVLSALGLVFDPVKFKPQVNMSIQRFKLVRRMCYALCGAQFRVNVFHAHFVCGSLLQQIQHKTEEIARDRREICALLQAKKFDSARIRVWR